MTIYVGLDVHKQTIEVCILNDPGQVEARHQLACEQTAITEFARTRLRREDQVVLEATTNTWRVVELLRPHVGRVVVGNPLKTRAIAEAKIKTDKLDAAVLAQLLRCDYLPAVWEPDADTQELRRLTGHRANLVNDRSRIKNRINSLLAQRLIKPPVSVLFTKTGLAWLKGFELAADDRLLVDGQLRLIEQVDAELKLLDQRLAKIAYAQEQARLLMTLPGFGYPVALSVLAALGDLSRFRDGDHAASYLGLVPATYQSASHWHHGAITKTGNRQARWMLTQAAQQAIHQPGPLGVFFRRLCRRKNRNVAIVATARKLVTIAFLMLKNREPYRYALPHPTEKKLAELRVLATGERRSRQGQAKRPGVPRPAGIRAKNVRPLREVYQREGLPVSKTPENLPAGEQRMLQETGTLGVAKQVQQPSCILYRKSKANQQTSPAARQPAGSSLKVNDPAP